MNETELIARLREKDEGAFSELFKRYSSLVFNTALGLLQNQEEAEDLVQEVFIDVLRASKRTKTWWFSE